MSFSILSSSTTTISKASASSVLGLARPLLSQTRLAQSRHFSCSARLPFAGLSTHQKVIDCESWTTTLADLHYSKTENDMRADDKPENRFVVTWDHAAATSNQVRAVSVAHHVPECLSDRLAQKTLLTVRSLFDIFTGYRHPPPGKENDPKYQMTARQWLMRFVFLESVAGVPGMVGGMVRHLHSLRLMRRDKAWIETLLEEAYNERMHLLTFLKLYNPGWFMRFCLLVGQGVFFNVFFAAYLVMPRICHRFVGYLEEEAVVTYTRCLEDIDAGRLPEWKTMRAPGVATEYWNMPKDSTMYDLIMYVRADEAKHREVNHTFGNLVQKHDRNPYALKIEDHHTPQPSADLSAPKPTGWKRKEIAA